MAFIAQAKIFLIYFVCVEIPNGYHCNDACICICCFKEETKIVLLRPNIGQIPPPRQANPQSKRLVTVFFSKNRVIQLKIFKSSPRSTNQSSDSHLSVLNFSAVIFLSDYNILYIKILFASLARDATPNYSQTTSHLSQLRLKWKVVWLLTKRCSVYKIVAPVWSVRQKVL